MIQPLAVSLFAVFWASIYLFNVILRTYWPHFYLELLAHMGVSFHFLQIRWFTTRLNRFFIRVGQSDKFPWRLWFNFGVVFALLVMPLGTGLLTLLAYNTLARHQAIEQQVLQPVMPGVNLPLNQLIYYLGTLLFCGILHEMGHAIAAVRERVRVSGFGIFFMAIYPGAFVELHTADVQSVSTLRQLRVYCAGVWHNAVLAAVALAITLWLPWVLLPFYSTGQGAAITWVRDNSVVSGRRGLIRGELVTRINNCPVMNSNDWHICLKKISTNGVLGGGGYCMPLAALRQLDSSNAFGNIKRRSHMPHLSIYGAVECCMNQTNTHLCFVYHAPAPRYACLPARLVTERPNCQHSTDCLLEHTCLFPSVANRTRLVRLVHHSLRPPLLFLGDTNDLEASVTVSDWIPRWGLVPLDGPHVLMTFAQYFVSLSGALALLNVVPCYALDGQWILLAVLQSLSVRFHVTEQFRNCIFAAFLLSGTALLLLNVLLALWMLFS